MTASLYNQPPISVSEQLLLLKRDGLVFKDEDKARHILENISLFRIKSYLKPFRRTGERSFRDGATFESAYSLYRFDSELRKMVCAELEKIEISIRTQLSLIMSEEAGCFWFEDVANFRDPLRHEGLLLSLQNELRRNDDDAIIDFQRKYSNTFPPSWITFEIGSFGTLSMMYRWLKAGRARRQLAYFYGLTDTVMESWLHSIVYVRNICAHHSRLWNRQLSINAIVPRRTYLPFITIPSDIKRVYYILSIILYFLQTVNPTSTFGRRFKALLLKYPDINVSAMGFPIDWEDEVLWRT
ncbi:MAG: Abi family protein [Duncaniella sp.]|uniref:Abi family protein n=1 Tax=Duncaniella sp. TaxID=2518496 RepID=UPI0023C25B42|nr:Abi family protein [Duncaniella sp.]MDE6090052.1 Abi family protein [Duncaniella sp.]